MKKTISLNEYLRLGGKISKKFFEENLAICTYSSDDNYFKKRVISFEDRGDKNCHGKPLYWFEFKDGSKKRFSAVWIDVEVEFVLAPKYNNY